MLRENHFSRFVCLIVALVLAACGDDDGGQNNNANQNNGNETPVCGNGQVETGEECDEGTANSDVLPDACRSTCQRAYCGDDVVDASELCDDGPYTGQSPSSCKAGCVPNVCGDGYVGGTEVCDDGNTEDWGGCRGDCGQDMTKCGNGVPDPGETCDQGGSNSDTAPNACRKNCQVARCGDSVIDTGEMCDGSTLGGQTCEDYGYVNPGGLACSATCTFDDSGCAAVCGNGAIEPGEDCDDNDPVGGDGCSSLCVVEGGWKCTTAEPSVCWPERFVTIDASAFTMGSPAEEPGRGSNETQHLVTLTHRFEIWATEVTQGQFEGVMGYNPSSFASCGSTCPVEQVSWHEAAAFCNALSDASGLDPCYSCIGTAPDFTCTSDATPYDCEGFRLPTEAEWEYAARAGTSTGTYNGTSTFLNCETTNTVLNPIAWFCGNAGSATHVVAGKLVNPWGLFDMLGNVYEWVHDWYADYASGSETDPWGPAAGTNRVFRGGCWINLAQFARAAYRSDYDPANRFFNLGFRPARSRF